MDHEVDYANGPLWAARLLPWCSSQDSFVRDSTSGDAEVAKFPHTCHIVLFFCHFITDGHSCIRIVRSILSMFNAILNENDIDDSEQIATLLDISREGQLRALMKKKLSDDPKLLSSKTDLLKSHFGATQIEKLYPVAPMLKPKTVTLTHVVPEEKTMKFISKCKHEGVTVHLGFTALLDRAIAELLAEKGFAEASLQIASGHSVDLRSYYENCVDEFGFGVSFLFSSEKHKLEQDFWDVARKYQAHFKQNFKDQALFEMDVIEELTGYTPLALTSPEGQEHPSDNCIYYATTNMRDITGLVGNCGENIQLEYIDRLTSVQLYQTLWLSSFQTFRGRFLHSLQYNSHVTSAETAQKYSQKLFSLMEKVTLS